MLKQVVFSGVIDHLINGIMEEGKHLLYPEELSMSEKHTAIIYSTPATGIHKIWERAGISHLVPGWLMILIGVLFNGTLLVWALITLK